MKSVLTDFDERGPSIIIMKKLAFRAKHDMVCNTDSNTTVTIMQINDDDNNDDYHPKTKPQKAVAINTS